MICVNRPPTYTVDAVGPGTNASTDPFTVGANPELIAPVVASNANRCERDNTGEPPAGLTLVNVPPTTIVFPTCVIECVCPLLIHGVNAAGTAPTTSFLTREADAAPAVDRPRNAVTTTTTMETAERRARM